MRAGYIIVITRMLGAELYGVWSYALSAYALAVGAASLGLEIIVPIRLGAEKSGARRLAASALGLRLALLALAALALLIFALAFESNDLVRAALLLSIPAIFGRGVGYLVRSLFLGHEAVGVYVRTASAIRAGEVALGVALLINGGGVLSIIALHAASWLIEGLAALFLMRRLPGSGPQRPDAGTALSLAREGALVGVSSAVVAWMSTGPILLIRQFTNDLEILAQVALCLQISMMLTMTTHSVLQAALPVLGRTKASGDARIGRYAPGVLGIAVAAGLPLAALAYAFGPQAFAVILGEDFRLAGALAGPAILVATVMTGGVGFAQMLTVEGKLGRLTAANVAAALSFTLAAPVAFTLAGALGVIFAVGLGWFVRGALMAGFVSMGAAKPA